MTKEIKLTKGYIAIVDDLDFEWINRFNWYADDSSDTTIYAKNDSLPGRPRMHVFLMQPKPGFDVNHKDGNGLNNTRNNLQVLTRADHQRLSPKRRNTKLKSRGVVQQKSGKFYAEIYVNSKRHHLGTFNTEVEAAKAYNEAGIRLLGKDNFIANQIE